MVRRRETTPAEMAERLEWNVSRSMLDAEIMRLASEVVPGVTAHVVTMSTNNVRRVATNMGLPIETLDDLLAVPMPEGSVGSWPANWGAKSAALWNAMRAACR